MCVKAKKNKESFSLAKKYIRNIVIDLIIVKLFRICLVVFPFNEKSFPHKYLCILCDFYLELVILVIILFGTQQVVSEFGCLFLCEIRWKRMDCFD